MLPSDQAGQEAIAKETQGGGGNVVELPEITVTPEPEPEPEKTGETVSAAAPEGQAAEAGARPAPDDSAGAYHAIDTKNMETEPTAAPTAAEPESAAEAAAPTEATPEGRVAAAGAEALGGETEGAPAAKGEDAYQAIDTNNMEVGPPIGPKERAHMPLSAVAHWIASEGGAISITADEKWWRPAFEKLLTAIVSDRLEVGGRRSGLPETIPKAVFVGIPVAYPCSPNSLHLWTGDGPYLECQLFIDEANWQETGGDKLFRSGRHARAEWTHLQVPSSTVARLWRFRHGNAAHEERVAMSALAALLREEPGLTIENACQHCDEFGHFGRVVFKRIWQKARESAGLQAKASPGRPRKSGR